MGGNSNSWRKGSEYLFSENLVLQRTRNSVLTPFSDLPSPAEHAGRAHTFGRGRLTLAQIGSLRRRKRRRSRCRRIFARGASTNHLRQSTLAVEMTETRGLNTATGSLVIWTRSLARHLRRHLLARRSSFCTSTSAAARHALRADRFEIAWRQNWNVAKRSADEVVFCIRSEGG
jgi:hypothetical protein